MSVWKARLLAMLVQADAATRADAAYMTESELFSLYLFLSQRLGT